MYHSEYFSLQKKHVVDQDPQTLCFSIPLFDKDNVTYIVRMISDSWIGKFVVIRSLRISVLSQVTKYANNVIF